MSAPGKKDAFVMPSITGNPAVDSLLRGALVAATMGITTVIVTWLNAHGFYDPNYGLMISGAIFSTLCTIAVMAWGYVNAKLTKRAVVVQTVVAATTGEVPHAVTKAITPADEVAITKELNKAQIRKEAAANE